MHIWSLYTDRQRRQILCDIDEQCWLGLCDRCVSMVTVLCFASSLAFIRIVWGVPQIVSTLENLRCFAASSPMQPNADQQCNLVIPAIICLISWNLLVYAFVLFWVYFNNFRMFERGNPTTVDSKYFLVKGHNFVNGLVFFWKCPSCN